MTHPTPDPLDAIVAEALAELDALCLLANLAPYDPTYREPIMRAFDALVADRARQAERNRDLRAVCQTAYTAMTARRDSGMVMTDFERKALHDLRAVLIEEQR